jgi:DNA repair protein RadC
MNSHTSIAEMPEEDRPRERLARIGVRRLRDAEVMALVVGSGSRSASSVELAQVVLKKLGGPAGLRQASVEDLLAVPGVGGALAARIAGAMELARRAAARERISAAGAKPPGPGCADGAAGRGPD